MDWAQPIEVMLQNIEQVQRFLLQNPEEDRQLTQVNLIGYAVIKLSKTGGMYQKALEKWQLRDVDERKSWAAFSKFMVEQYKRLLKLGTGITMGQEDMGQHSMPPLPQMEMTCSQRASSIMRNTLPPLNQRSATSRTVWAC